MAATSEATQVVELFQRQNDQGSLHGVLSDGAPVLVPDLAAEAARWPGIASVATAAGFRSAHALPLRLRREVLGAFNLLRAETGALSPAPPLRGRPGGRGRDPPLGDLQRAATVNARSPRERRLG